MNSPLYAQDAPAPAHSSFLRPLGAFEEMMWLFDLHSAVHFVMVAEILGVFSDDELRKALLQLQRRHPLLSTCIRPDSDGSPFFPHVPNAEIPLHVIRDPSMSWESVVEDQIHNRFDPRRAPLMRAVVIRDGLRSRLILATHHSTGDALSSVYAIRDILKALAGEHLDVLPSKPPRETLFGLPTPKGQPRLQPDVDHWLYRVKHPRPRVDSLRLHPDLTRKLKDACRRESTTVHGALGASLAIAGRSLSLDWREAPLRVMSSVSIRELLGVNEEHMLSLGGGEVTFGPHESALFWDLARTMKAGLSQVHIRDGVAPLIERANQAVASGLTVDIAAELLKHAFAAQTMISNLGQLPFDSAFGQLELEALWGPAALRGVDGEQTLGTITVNGALHLVHTSYVPIEGLLQGIEKTLRAVSI